MSNYTKGLIAFTALMVAGLTAFAMMVILVLGISHPWLFKVFWSLGGVLVAAAVLVFAFSAEERAFSDYLHGKGPRPR